MSRTTKQLQVSTPIQLCVRVLEEYVDQHFRESTRSAAEMFLNRKRMERIL